MDYTIQLPELSRKTLERMLTTVDRQIPTSHSLAQGVVITAVEYNPRTSNGIDQGKVLYQDGTALFFQRTKRDSTTTEWVHLGLNDKYARTEKGRVLLTEIGNPIDQIEVIVSHHARHLFAKAIARERHDYRSGQTRLIRPLLRKGFLLLQVPRHQILCRVVRVQALLCCLLAC